jgi:hypothetical protein
MFDFVDLLDKLRAGYPAMSATALVAIGFSLGLAGAWAVFRQQLNVRADRIEYLQSKLGEPTAKIGIGAKLSVSDIYSVPNSSGAVSWRIKIHNDVLSNATPSVFACIRRVNPSISAQSPYIPFFPTAHQALFEPDCRQVPLY